MAIFFYKNYMSNFSQSPFICKDGIVFNNTEQYFMYHKAMFFGDTVTANKILNTSDPMQAKTLGREVKGYINITWDNVRFDVMYQANEYKYNQNLDLAILLKETGNEIIIESSPVDKIWGVGMDIATCKKNPIDVVLANGQNLLGNVLMLIRTQLPSLESLLKLRELQNAKKLYNGNIY